ncbi:MAG: TlpA family protein disulfide reductase [Gammaproteobacteria bacterium]|nr:TlpA family protein disulfide reductase [Gammaproteobacteria bacterium]
MNRFAQSILFVAVLAISGFAGYQLYRYSMPENQPLSVVETSASGSVSQEQLNAFVLDDPDGVSYRLGQWHGQPQIVNYWATWCAPCRKEVPLLVALQDEFSDEQLVIIGLSMDYPEDTAVVKEFMSEQAIDYPILMASDVGHEIAGVYGSNNFALPISIFVAADGSIGGIHLGELKRAEAEQMLKDIL